MGWSLPWAKQTYREFAEEAEAINSDVKFDKASMDDAF